MQSVTVAQRVWIRDGGSANGPLVSEYGPFVLSRTGVTTDSHPDRFAPPSLIFPLIFRGWVSVRQIRTPSFDVCLPQINTEAIVSPTTVNKVVDTYGGPEGQFCAVARTSCAVARTSCAVARMSCAVARMSCAVCTNELRCRTNKTALSHE